MNRLLSYLLAVVGFVFVALFGTGCVASFAGRELPQRGLAGLTNHGIAVDYDTVWLISGRPNPNAANGSAWPWCGGSSSCQEPQLSNELSRSVRSLLEQSKMFASICGGPQPWISRCQEEAGGAPVQLHFMMKHVFEPGEAVVTGLIAVLTLGITPMYARADYILSVSVNKGARVLKAYEYREYITSWAHILLIVVPGHGSEVVAEQVISNMLRVFLHDLQRDIDSGRIPVTG